MTILKTETIKYKLSEADLKEAIFKHLKACGEEAHFSWDNIEMHASLDDDGLLLGVWATVEIKINENIKPKKITAETK